MGPAARFAALCALVVATLPGEILAGPPTDPSPRTRQPAASVKVLHLHVRGDLDSMRLAKDFADRYAAAIDDGTEVLLLELSGDKWRADAVHAIARALRQPQSQGSHNPRAGIRVLALLNDEADRCVGFGQAALALLADQCAITPRTRVTFEAAGDLRASAPPETDWERVDRELQGMLYLAAKDRQADVMLAAVFPRPTGPLWATPAQSATAPWKLTTNPNDDPARMLVVAASEPERPAKVELDAPMLRRLGVTTMEATDAGQMLAADGLRARPIVRAELVSGLGEARGRIELVIRKLDECLGLVESDLARATKLRGQDAPKRKRDAGDAALRLIAEAESRLLSAEAVMTDYPELLAGLPPGRTPVGQEAAKHPMLWRWLFQDRRDQITALRGEAESLSRTP